MAGRHASRPIPVVVTSFSTLSPTVGQPETAIVRFIRGKQPLADVPMVAMVHLGARALLHLGSAKTNQKGEASVRFRIPRSAAGQWLSVVTVLHYQRRIYRGSSHFKVAEKKR